MKSVTLLSMGTNMACIGHNILRVFSADGTHPHDSKFGLGLGVVVLIFLSLIKKKRVFFFKYYYYSWNKSLRKRGTEMPQNEPKQTDDSESRQRWEISTQLTSLLS